MKRAANRHYGVLGGVFLLVALMLALALPSMASAGKRVPPADATPPITTDNLDSCSGSVFVVSLTATDNGSGVADTYYSIDGGNWTSGHSVRIVMARAHKINGLSPGAHSLRYYSDDNRGNAEMPTTVEFVL